MKLEDLNPIPDDEHIFVSGWIGVALAVLLGFLTGIAMYHD